MKFYYQSAVFIFSFLTASVLAQVDYSDQIQPIFNENCTVCHGDQNNLWLDSYTNLMAGDSDNGPVIIIGNHASSLLWQYINSGIMPPGNTDLTPADIDSIAQWIDNGATLKISPVQMVSQFQINPIYPNPFNPSATIS